MVQAALDLIFSCFAFAKTERRMHETLTFLEIHTHTYMLFDVEMLLNLYDYVHSNHKAA